MWTKFLSAQKMLVLAICLLLGSSLSASARPEPDDCPWRRQRPILRNRTLVLKGTLQTVDIMPGKSDLWMKITDTGTIGVLPATSFSVVFPEKCAGTADLMHAEHQRWQDWYRTLSERLFRNWVGSSPPFGQATVRLISVKGAPLAIMESGNIYCDEHSYDAFVTAIHQTVNRAGPAQAFPDPRADSIVMDMTFGADPRQFPRYHSESMKVLTISNTSLKEK